MLISRVLLAACLKALAGLCALVCLLLALVVAKALFGAGWAAESAQGLTMSAAFAAGALVCWWAARRIAP